MSCLPSNSSQFRTSSSQSSILITGEKETQSSGEREEWCLVWGRTQSSSVASQFATLLPPARKGCGEHCRKPRRLHANVKLRLVSKHAAHACSDTTVVHRVAGLVMEQGVCPTRPTVARTQRGVKVEDSVRAEGPHKAGLERKVGVVV